MNFKICKYLKLIKYPIIIIGILISSYQLNSQTLLFNETPVSDVGVSNNIGKANTSRNIAIDNAGNIFVVFTGSNGIRVAKSEDRGATFLPSIQVSAVTGNIEPEIIINNQGIIFVAWVENEEIKLSKSINAGLTYSSEIVVGPITISQVTFEDNETVHLSTFDNNLYITDRSGENVYSNSNNGDGPFTNINLPNFAYSDIFVDQNGVIYAPRDNPTLELYNSVDNGQSFNQIIIPNSPQVFFSSYTLSDGPCGTFIFVAGSGSLGYKIDVSDGSTEAITFGESNITSHARTLFADTQGTIIDGYKNDLSELVISVSFDQGGIFNPPILISDGESHNIDRNTFYNDIVVAYSKNDQVFVTVYTDLLKGIEIIEPNPAIDICSGTSFDLPFTLTGSFSPNTTFSAILSDASGSFQNSTNVGELITNMDGSINVTLPSLLTPSSDYRLLIESIVDCTQSQPINISVGNIDIVQPNNLAECQNENGLAEFDLTSQITSILNGQTNIDLTFHTTEDDANNNVGAILDTATFLSNSTTIWVRAQSQESIVCYGITNFDIEALVAPNLIEMISLDQCDVDQDGITLFNLTETNSIITSNSAFDFTYYMTEIEAISGDPSTQITNVTAYQNPTPLNSVVYARIEADTGCFDTVQINLNVGATQIPQNFELIYESCDDVDFGSNIDGISTFNFSNAASQIEGLFPAGQNLETTFYLNENDALQELNAITNLIDYRNVLSPNSQTIWVRVDNLDNNGCEGLGPHVILNVLEVPINNPISNYQLCSDNGNSTFDLTTKDAEVVGTQTQNFIINYYQSLADAENDIPIANPNNYVSSGQTIFVRATYDTNNDGIANLGECYNAIDMQFNLVINSLPVIFEPDPIEICSEQLNTIYDLTINESQILNGDSSLEINYFESENDINNNNPIQNPSTYLNTQLSRDIIVLVTNVNNCVSSQIQRLNTTLYDDYNFNPLPIEECEVDNDGYDNFDLTRVEPDILNLLDASAANDLNISDYIFTYYELESDASLAIEDLSRSISDQTTFINTIFSQQIIYVRVTKISGSNNQCFAVIPVTLIVNSAPPIPIADQYVICLSNTNSVIDNVNTTFIENPPIDTELSSNDYTFQWYTGSEQDVIINPIEHILVGEIAPMFNPTAPGTYTVITTNNETGCTVAASTLVIASYPPESITLELISPTFSGTNTLEVIVVGNGEYNYSLDNGLWQDSPIFNNVAGGEHEVRVRDIYNCNMLIAVKSIIDYPRYFTPNSDGYRDTWNITSIANQPDAKIYVFDRYGKLLKQLNPGSVGWDGTYNGNKMPTSDYWFTVEYIEPLDNIKRVFKAHFTLKR
ncbi:T9SS type B sorting domain-containing protein [Winogradskyella sp. PE311]|uniref:T9SS type B sorting domain-containing protein n=1 Tax=Winogradskyella sp. PE311 TaxID=3366943 RepID=UPI00397F9DBD